MANFTVDENWVAASSLTTIAADTDYLIQTQGTGDLYVRAGFGKVSFSICAAE